MGKFNRRMTDYIKGEFQPIFLVGMSRHNLSDEVDNKQIAEDVYARKDIKIDPNSKATGFEDSFLPKTPAVDLLRKKIDNVIKSINKHLVETGEPWAHILGPGESTMFHTHDKPGPAGLSFAYWVDFPKDSGNFVGILQVDKMRHFHEVKPKAGDLVVFPTYLPHITTRNCSEETRISISGNYYPDMNKLDEIQKDPGSLFNYVGIVNGSGG